MSELSVIANDLKSWFGKVFKNAPKDTAIALGILNTAAPLFEEAIAIEDPALELVIAPYITVVQADLGTVASMLKNGNITNIPSFFAAIKSNFSALLTAAKITNPASVAKANAFLSVIENVEAAIPAAA